jgi:hypothetical protein
MATNDEVLEAFSKNAGYIVQLETENERLRAALDSIGDLGDPKKYTEAKLIGAIACAREALGLPVAGSGEANG